MKSVACKIRGLDCTEEVAVLMALATMVIGGLVSGTLLMLGGLPALNRFFPWGEEVQEQHAMEASTMRLAEGCVCCATAPPRCIHSMQEEEGRYACGRC